MNFLFHAPRQAELLAVNTLERRQCAWQEMRQKVQEAEADLAAGRVGPFDAEQTKRALRERLRQEGVSE